MAGVDLLRPSRDGDQFHYQSHEEEIPLGDAGPTTRTGDRITVIYDPADPGRVALPGAYNDPGWAVWS